ASLQRLQICDKALAVAGENLRLTRQRMDLQDAEMSEMLDAMEAMAAAEARRHSAVFACYRSGTALEFAAAMPGRVLPECDPCKPKGDLKESSK
ncbi:MAG: hypothetical protein HQL31_07215, partial [Planctomycetes bacterium]|nr:hypothetical protein [Planctomycetota bacterium]